MIEELDVVECAKKITDYVVIDVRTHDEFENDYGHIKGSMCYTLQDEFQNKVKELPKDKKYLFVCRSGRRSLFAAELALENGIEDVTNMIGGIMAWTEADLPTEK